MTTDIVERKESTSLAEWSVMKDQAAMLVMTGFLPKGMTAEQTVAIMLTGRELGIPPMVALRKINVINGNPTVAPELMLGLCLRDIRGFKHKILSEDQNHCTFWAARPVEGGGFIEYTGTFSDADAKQAGLLNKQNWQTYRGAMLRARAISLTLRVVAPDVIMGLYTPDEMGAVVNAEGEVIDIPAPEASDQTAETAPTSKPAPRGRPKGKPSSGETPTCAVCDRLIEARTSKDGRAYTVEQQVQWTMRDYGKVLCAEHSWEAKQAKKKAQADGQATNEPGEDDWKDRAVEDATHPNDS